MTRFSRSVIWFDRLLLTAATVIMTMIALRNLRDPIGATLPTGIVLNSSTAITVIRVGFGGFPLGFAAALLGCLVSNRRLLTGISLVAAVIGAATVARIQGLLVDGVTSYNMALLRPEIVMLTLSLVAIVLERRRQQQDRRQQLPGLSASR
jgi:fucose permease